MQQKRRVAASLKEIETILRDFDLEWNTLSKQLQLKLIRFIQICNQNYVEKFNWLREKQYAKIVNWKSDERKKEKKQTRLFEIQKQTKIWKNAQQNERVNSMVLNKSNHDLNLNHKLLLLRGLNFVPTPNWNERIQDVEWLNLMSHIRRAEWNHVYNNSNDESETNDECIDLVDLPQKLKIKKFNRPQPSQLNDKMVTYRELISTKLPNLEPQVAKFRATNKEMFQKHNNLRLNLRKALQELSNLVNSNKIVICRSDKNGKLLLLITPITAQLCRENYNNLLIFKTWTPII